MEAPSHVGGVMAESADQAVRLLTIEGPFTEFVEPPADLGVTIRSRSKTIGFGGHDLLRFLLEVPWDQYGSDLVRDMLAAWLYDLFTRNRTAAKAVEIKINGKALTADSEAELKKWLSEHLRDD